MGQWVSKSVCDPHCVLCLSGSVGSIGNCHLAAIGQTFGGHWGDIWGILVNGLLVGSARWVCEVQVGQWVCKVSQSIVSFVNLGSVGSIGPVESRSYLTQQIILRRSACVWVLRTIFWHHIGLLGFQKVCKNNIC